MHLGCVLATLGVVGLLAAGYFVWKHRLWEIFQKDSPPPPTAPPPIPLSKRGGKP